MEALIRVDASLDIGTGHVMRCLTLAIEWRARTKPEIVFVCRELEGNLGDLIERAGFRVIRLAKPNNFDHHNVENSAADYSDWLLTTESEDANEVVRCIGSRKTDFVIVDHYALGETWEQIIRKSSRRIIVLDDLANRAHDCDVLFDSSPGGSVKAYQELLPRESSCFVGPEFAILRKEFLINRPTDENQLRKSGCHRILVAMGGVDKKNITMDALEAIQRSTAPIDAQITVVLGENAPWIDAVREKLRTMHQRTCLMVNVSNMSELMSTSDLAIGAAGTTALERCCMGLPSIQVVLADNQIRSAAALEALGAAVTASGSDVAESIRIKLDDLIKSPERMVVMSRRAASIVDGLGTSRILDRMGVNRHRNPNEQDSY